MQDCFKIYYKKIEILGVAAFIIACFVYIWKQEWMTPNFFDLSPLMILEASGMFIFIYRREQMLCKNEQMNRGMQIIAKYTFPIYMIHEFIRWRFDDILMIITNKVLYSLAWICCTFVMSFCVSVIIDNTVIKFIQFVINKLIDFASKWVALVFDKIFIAVSISLHRNKS